MNLWISFFERWIGWLYGIVNDYGIAIILITVCVRLLLLPLNLKQRKSMEQLGKEDGTGAKGCLLSLIQFPIMLCLYHAIRQTAAVNVRTMLLPWVPSGIGLYYFMSGLFQAAEQFVYYQGRVHRPKSAE